MTLGDTGGMWESSPGLLAACITVQAAGAAVVCLSPLAVQGLCCHSCPLPTTTFMPSADHRSLGLLLTITWVTGQEWLSHQIIASDHWQFLLDLLLSGKFGPFVLRTLVQMSGFPPYARHAVNVSLFVWTPLKVLHWEGLLFIFYFFCHFVVAQFTIQQETFTAISKWGFGLFFNVHFKSKIKCLVCKRQFCLTTKFFYYVCLRYFWFIIIIIIYFLVLDVYNKALTFLK